MPTDTLRIPARYCGPARSANGGYACGRLGAYVEGPARVSLKAPPPLDRDMVLRRDGDTVVLVEETPEGERLTGLAAPGEVDVEVPEPLSPAQLAASRSAYLAAAADHALPRCFVCGPRRAPGDGLQLFTGPIAGTDRVGAHWEPAADLAADDGLLAPEILWAALDCPSYFALGLHGTFALLGQLTAEVRRRPAPGEALQVLAWPRRSEGRKHFADSAVLDAEGEAIAVANALWIEVKDPAFLRRLAEENA
ncbi:MAG: hypothetical protein AAGH15_23115 [Myxococcota bacterium]